MTHTTTDLSLRKTARLAGLLYFTGALTAPFTLLYLPSKIIVKGDAGATARNLLVNEFLFRSGIVAGIAGIVLSVFVLFALYKLFRQVNEYQAKLMVVLALLPLPAGLIFETFSITSLMILKGEVLKSLEPEQQQDMAMLFLKIRGYGILILEIFWGLWLIPFGQLVWKSGFIPRILGVFLMLNGIAYILMSVTFLLFPHYQALVGRYTFPFLFGELAIILWLLIIGAKIRKIPGEV